MKDMGAPIMKPVITGIICLFGIFSIGQAATITTSTTVPSASDYFADAFNTTDGQPFRIDGNDESIGQSFTHTTAGGEDWYLTSITFLTESGAGSATESTSGLELRILSGNDGDTASTPLATFTFSGTWNSTAGNYATFALSTVESQTTLGALTSGAQYTALIVGDVTNDFRLARSNGGNPYAGGGAWFQDADRGASNNDDVVFFVNGTVVPEPSTLGLLVLGFGSLIFLRRR